MTLPRRTRKWLRDATNMSIEQIAALIAAERVTLRAPGARPKVVDEETLVFEGDDVFIDNDRVEPLEKEKGAFILFKPKGVVTTASDPNRRPDLSAWLAHLPAGYFPVGRLDRETSGALLFVNDGDLATAILRPEHKLEKTYWLWLNESLSESDPRLLSWLSGVKMLGTVARAQRVQVLRTTGDYTEILVVLREGRNRQIRRMCRSSDFRLLHLHRLSIGPIDLSTLEPGQLRMLDAPELEMLWKSVGGKHKVRGAQLAALRRKAQAARHEGSPLLRLEQWLARLSQKE